MDKIRTTVQNLRRQIRSLRDTVSAEHAGQDQACMRNEWEALRRQLHCALQDTYQPSEQLNRDQAGPDQLIQQDNPTRSPLPRHRWKPLPAADVVPDPPPPTSANAVPMDKRSPPTVRPKSSVYTPRRSPAKTSQTRRSPARIIDPLPRSSPRRAASFYVKPEDKPQAMPAQLSPQSARPSTAAAKQSPVRGDGSASARPTTSEKAQSSASEQRPLSEFWNRRSVDARQSAQASSSPRSSPPNLHRATTFQPSNFQLPSKYTGTGRSFSPEQQERSSSSSKPLPEVTSPTATSVPKPQLLRRQAHTPLTTPSESLTSAASSAKQPDSPNEGKASALPRVKDSRSATRVDADNTRIGNDADSKMGKCKPSLTNLAKLAGVQWSCNDTRSWLEKFTEVCDYFQSGIVVVDIHAAGLPICWANEAFKTLVGYTSKAAVGRNCQFLEGSATEMHIVQDIARRMREPNKDSKPMRITNHTQAGKAFKYTLSLHPIWDPEGAQVFCVGVICPTSGKCELVEEIRRLMPTLCDKHPTAHTTTLSAFDKEAAARMLNRCRAIFKLDYDAGLSALFSLQETRAMLEAFVLDRSEPERFDLEISRVTENFQHRLYVAKEERLRAKDFKADVESAFADEAAKLCELITDEPIEPKLAVSKLKELGIASRKIICEKYIGDFLHSKSFEEFFISRCGDITAAASNSWCTALRDRLWQDYDAPADCLPWLLSLAFALEFFPRPLVIGDCNRFGNSIIYANRAFCQLTEYDREEVLGRKPDFLHGPKTETDVLKEIEAMFQNGGDCHAVLTNYRRAGGPWQNVLSIATMKDSSGALRFSFGMLGQLSKDLGYEPEIREERLRRNCRLLSLLPLRLEDMYSEPLWEGTAAAEEAIDALVEKVKKALIISKARRSDFVNRFKQPLTRRIPLSSITGS